MPTTQHPRRALRVVRILGMAALLLTGASACGDASGEAELGQEEAPEPSSEAGDDTDEASDEGIDDELPDDDLDDDVQDLFGNEIPDGFPEAMPLPDEYEVTSAIGSPEAGFTVTLETSEPAEELAELYETGLTDAGWTVVVDVADAEATGTETRYAVEADAPDGSDSVLVTVQDKGHHTGVHILTGGPPQ